MIFWFIYPQRTEQSHGYQCSHILIGICKIYIIHIVQLYIFISKKKTPVSLLILLLIYREGKLIENINFKKIINRTSFMGNLEVGFIKKKKRTCFILGRFVVSNFFLACYHAFFFFMIPTFFLGRKRAFLHFSKKLSFIKSYPRTFI